MGKIIIIFEGFLHQTQSQIYRLGYNNNPQNPHMYPKIL